jgi:hypothetical protein
MLEEAEEEGCQPCTGRTVGLMLVAAVMLQAYHGSAGVGWAPMSGAAAAAVVIPFFAREYMYCGVD